MFCQANGEKTTQKHPITGPRCADQAFQWKVHVKADLTRWLNGHGSKRGHDIISHTWLGDFSWTQGYSSVPMLNIRQDKCADLRPYLLVPSGLWTSSWGDGRPFMGRWDNTMSSSTPFSACFIMKDALLHSTLLAGLAKTLEGNPYRKRTTKKGNCCVGGSKQEWDNNVWCIAGLFDHHWLLQILPKSPQFGTTLRSSIYSVSGIEARFFLGTPDKKCGLAVQYPKTRCFFLCSAFLTRVFQENVQDCPLGWLMWGCVTNLGNPYPLVI